MADWYCCICGFAGVGRPLCEQTGLGRERHDTGGTLMSCTEGMPMPETIKNLTISTIKIASSFAPKWATWKSLPSRSTVVCYNPSALPASGLVFGYRRLLAYRDILNRRPSRPESSMCRRSWKDVDRECDAKGLTVSSVWLSIGGQAELGNRRGQRTDLDFLRNCAEVEPGETTRIAPPNALAGESRTAERPKPSSRLGFPNSSRPWTRRSVDHSGG